MNATDARHPAPQRTHHWTAARIFRTAFAITLGVVMALVVTGALFSVAFAGTGRVGHESDGVVEEVSDQTIDVAAASSVSVA